MSEFTPEELYDTLRIAEFEPRVLRAEGGALLLTVRGGRVLGVHLDGFAENLLWVNAAAVQSVDAARKFAWDDEWNIGGDRIWLSPEVELHFVDSEHPSVDGYKVARAVDPGSYAMEREAAGGVALHNAGRVSNTWTHGSFTFSARRDIRLCESPVPTDGLAYIGYETSSYFEVQSADHLASRYGMWHLMQIPAGGAVYVPCHREPELVDYFQTGVAGHCSSIAGGVRFPVTGRTRHKLGLSSHDVRGRMGYVRGLADGRATLIVRQAAVFPGAFYADYPAGERSRRDIAFQFFNDDGHYGGFGEMEYHTPAAGPQGMDHSRDVSRTWCFGGPEQPVRQLAAHLLGVPVEGG